MSMMLKMPNKVMPIFWSKRMETQYSYSGFLGLASFLQDSWNFLICISNEHSKRSSSYYCICPIPALSEIMLKFFSGYRPFGA